MSKQGLEKIKAIVSSEYFYTDENEVNLRSQFSIPYSKKPLGYVYPADRDQLQTIIKIANEYKIPLWPVSKGKNWGYGSATAVRENNLIVGLERMNQLEVNTELAYAIIEPGVTYRQLHQYLQDNNIPLAADPIDGTADASVLGNALDRGHGGTNYGDHYSTLCGLEVLLPNGTTMKTGGGPDNNQAFHTYKWGVGPSIEGLFSQGNFGIVVSAGIWLMPKHEHCVSVSLELADDQTMAEAVNAIRQLQLEGIIESKLTIANDYFMLSAAIDYPDELAPNGFLDDSAMGELRKRHNVPKWSAVAAIYGDSLTIKAKKRQIKKRLARFGQLFFLGDKMSNFIERVVNEKQAEPPRTNLYTIAGSLLEKVTKKSIKFFELAPNAHEHHKGIPSDFFVENSFFGDPACFASYGSAKEINLAEHRKGKIWFAPVVPLDGNQALFVINGCKAIFHKHRFDFASGLLLFNPRTVIAIAKITYLKDDDEHRERAQQLFDELHQWCVEHGYQVYRTNVAHMEQVTECAPEFKQFLNQIKEKVDPNNIIAPGKYGVG